MAQAAPDAAILTLNYNASQVTKAIVNLLPYPNVKVQCGTSWEILEAYEGPELAVIFVDGDHKLAALDAPWFNQLAAGGLILFHDYTPIEAWSVVATVVAMGVALGRDPDIMIVDNNGIGMAGFYRRKEESIKGEQDHGNTQE